METKKVIIIGGGIAGLTAGILLQEAGFTTEIYEKNAVPGGLCTGWKREGYQIDNCIHWLTGSKEGNGLNELWNHIGALSPEIPLRRKESFLTSSLSGQTITFYRDKERTKRELLALSPDDEKEITKLFRYVEMAESMTVPVEKPFDEMSIMDYIKLGMSMKEMAAVMKEYGKQDISEFAGRFHHPLIRQAIVDYMPGGYQAYAFIVSYATVTGENGDIPAGGSFAMAARIAEKYKEKGGTILLSKEISRVLFSGKQAYGIQLPDGSEKKADFVVCACDPDVIFHRLLPEKMMPRKLKMQYEQFLTYPVGSAFQVAFAVDGVFPELSGTRYFSCSELTVGITNINRMNTLSYGYEPEFAPEGKTVLQSCIVQSINDVMYWQLLYKDRERYRAKKEELSAALASRIVDEYPFLAGKLRVLDVWTPMTYIRYCNAYQGSYMSFTITKHAKNLRIPGKLKELTNVFFASQWQMGPGGLPTACAMGKFAADRIKKIKDIEAKQE